MPIDLGKQVKETQIIRGTARFQSDPRATNGAMIANPMTQFYRATIEQVGNESRMIWDATPIEVRASDLEGLAEFAEIPDALQGAIAPSQLPELFKLVPALISMIGDAAERKKLAEASQPTNTTETSP